MVGNREVVGTSGFKCADAMKNVLDTNPPIVMLDSWTELGAYLDTVTEAKISGACLSTQNQTLVLC